jgi:hypothetical protein
MRTLGLALTVVALLVVAAPASAAEHVPGVEHYRSDTPFVWASPPAPIRFTYDPVHHRVLNFGANRDEVDEMDVKQDEHHRWAFHGRGSWEVDGFLVDDRARGRVLVTIFGRPTYLHWTARLIR